jgi:hypothetical protein
VVIAPVWLLRVILPPVVAVLKELRVPALISLLAVNLILPPALVVEEESTVPATELIVAPFKVMSPPSVITAPVRVKAPGLVIVKFPPLVDRLIELPKVKGEAKVKDKLPPFVLIWLPVDSPKILLRAV